MAKRENQTKFKIPDWRLAGTNFGFACAVSAFEYFPPLDDLDLDLGFGLWTTYFFLQHVYLYPLYVLD